MTRVNWIVLALLLMIPGAAGLGVGMLHERTVLRKTAEAAQAMSDAPSADEYLAMYERWSELPAEQKGETPWGQGEYGGPEIQQRLREDRSQRLEADLPELEAGTKSYPQQLAEVLYGSDWMSRLTEFQQERENRNLAMTVSAVLFFAGALLFCGGLIKWAASRAFDKNKDASPAAAEDASEATVKSFKKATENTECSSDEATEEEESHPASKPSRPSGYFRAIIKKGQLFEPKETPQVQTASEESEEMVTTVSEARPKPSGEAYFGWEAEEQPSEASALMTTEPVSRGLSELTEEVSAIRQFASAQQSQMQKLQAGYDWMLIRRFCLRIIRCIDNIEERITRLGNEDQLLQTSLEEIRDELVFALESSGVEQYRPDLNVSFKGLEKYAEAVRQRVATSDASQVGTIAEILRPGYQYLISDDDVKIVRCAQVKLYDTAGTEV